MKVLAYVVLSSIVMTLHNADIIMTVAFSVMALACLHAGPMLSTWVEG